MTSASMTSVPVRFHVPGARTGPVTLGQRNVLRWIGKDPSHRSDSVPAFAEVPPGTDLYEIADVVRLLLVRHESLRTTFTAGPDPVQRVIGDGEVSVEISEVQGEPYAFVRDLVSRMLAEPFGLTTGLPVRITAVTRDNEPFLVVFVFSHIAVDVAGAAIVGQQCAQLLDGGRDSWAPGVVGHQPVDQARWERSEAGERRIRSALRYWETQLRRVPQAMFAVPAHPDGSPGHCEVRMRSRAIAQALRTVVARNSVSHSTVIFAASATLLAVFTGSASNGLVSVCGNRFRTGWRDYAGTIAQDALVPFTLDPAATFAGVVRHIQAATMNAYRYAQFDSADLWAIIDAVSAERGTQFHRDCVFNDTGVHSDLRRIDSSTVDAAELAQATKQTRLEFADDRELPAAFFLTLAGISDEEVDIRLYADTRFLPAAQVQQFLLGVERLLVTEATTPLRVAEVPDLTGIRAVPRSADWHLIDSCWVDLAAVQRVLLDPFNGKVFVEDDRLVAYTSGDLTPEALHAACMAELAGQFSVMCPHRYVICASPPTDAGDHAAWRSRPVVRQGSGRSFGTGE
ncbi:condensation domain-containing protein [Kibdelosporangium phytohabitans]|nr:condensation domain-containing protein [Kibdelosporangium phytohabitans]MBE1461517.1 hypothetical protein [Kibdelosporangium phytohabitans]